MPQLSTNARSRMDDAVLAARTAAHAHDNVKSETALSTLADIIGRESRAGHLSAADARALRTGVAQARRRVQLDVVAPAPAAAVASTPPPPAAVSPPAASTAKGAKQGGKAKKSKGKGKG